MNTPETPYVSNLLFAVFAVEPQSNLYEASI